MVAREEQSASAPQAKISETFLRFASPLTDAMGEGIAKDEFESTLQVAFVVWNAVVFDAVAGNSGYVSELRRLSSANPMMAAMIESLVRRKEAEFPDDLWLIGKYTLTHNNGEWRLRVEARDPSPRVRTDRRA